eukprot:gene27647-7286_t
MTLRGLINSVARQASVAARWVEPSINSAAPSCVRHAQAQSPSPQLMGSLTALRASCIRHSFILPHRWTQSSCSSTPVSNNVGNYNSRNTAQVEERGVGSGRSGPKTSADGESGEGSAPIERTQKRRPERPDDPLELLIFAKESFLKELPLVSTHNASELLGGGIGRVRCSGDIDQPLERRAECQNDSLELLILAKESYLKKTDSVPIPPNVREVLYKYHWDKLLVDVRRTIEMTVKGKQEVYTAMVAVGNLQGLFGLGMGSASSAQEAVAFAYMDSYSKLVYIPLYRARTIYHHIDHQLHRMKMRLMPRREGWGIRASNLVTELCRIIGVKDISIKLNGRRDNKFFVAQCLMEALQQQSTSYDGVEGTGVYAREVFWAKKLPEGLLRGVDIP